MQEYVYRGLKKSLPKHKSFSLAVQRKVGHVSRFITIVHFSWKITFQTKGHLDFWAISITSFIYLYHVSSFKRRFYRKSSIRANLFSRSPRRGTILVGFTCICQEGDFFGWGTLPMTRVCFISVSESHSRDAWMLPNLQTREPSIRLNFFWLTLKLIFKDRVVSSVAVSFNLRLPLIWL